MKRGTVGESVRDLSRQLIRIDKEFAALWKNYLYQSLLAAVVTLIVFWMLSAEHAVIIASIGSTAFVVFTMPSYGTARSRRVIGGHMVGVVSGVLGILMLNLPVAPMVILAATVGISMFLMVALDFEHPPAAGTALGVAMGGFSIMVMVAVLTSAVALSLAHHYLKKYLKDLV